MSVERRPYQIKATVAVDAAVASGQNRILVKKPTGVGKTVWFASLLEYLLWLKGFPEKDRKMLVIAHREELLEQAAEKIHKANPHARIGIEQADRYASPFSDVVIASIQTLQASKFKRLKKLLARHTFRLVIIDEAHHAAAATYRTALVHLGFLPPADESSEENIEAAGYDDIAIMEHALEGWDARAPKDRLLIGVTATPNRSDAVGLGCVFQTIGYSYALKDAIDDGWLVPIVPWVVETEISLDAVRMNRGEFNQKELAEAVNVEQRNKLAAAGWQEHAEGRRTIAFTVDVAHAHTLASEFQARGIRALPLSGETPKDDRRLILQKIRDGRIDIVTNCMVLTEGTDLPMVSCILHAKPTKSATLYEQMTGRGLRTYESKKDCLVIDVVDIARKHSLLTAPVLYGLPPGLVCDGEELNEAERLINDILESCPGMAISGKFTLEQLRARARTFDIWQIPSMGEYGRGLILRWIRVDDTFRLAYPWGAPGETETLVIEPNMIGKHDVKLTVRGSKGSQGTPARTLASGMSSAHEALVFAETFIQRHRSRVLNIRSSAASWRSKPATVNQLDALKKWRVPIRKEITSGEASDLLDLARARFSRR